MPGDNDKDMAEGQYEETEMTPMNDDRRRDSKPNKHSSEGNARRKPKAISDLSVSAMSSFINSPATTKETGASPGRMRNLQVPPPIPRRADFGYYYPDGGWGWIVCGAAFTIHFLAHGLHLAFGVTLMEVINTFGTRTCDSVWLGSASMAASLLVSPLVVALCRRKSPRLIATVGGLITSLGCLFLSFSTQLHQMFISYVLVVGFGSGITLSAASVIVGAYFHKRRECSEMLILSGSGVGMALMATFIRQTVALLKWMRGLQALTGLLLLLVAAATLYRSPAIYHPRRRVILHIKNMRKTKKQQREFEGRPPYFDWSPLRMRSLQILMTSCAFTALGSYTPFALLGLDASRAVEPGEVSLLMVFYGLALASGSVLIGLLVIRSSLRCMITRQYLCQLTGFGCGFTTLLLPLVHGFHGYALYVWMYGLLYGGYMYSLKVYTCELASVKLSVTCWGYVNLAQSIPTLLGAPLSFYLEASQAVPARSGFLLAGTCMVIGSFILLLMPWASNHISNHLVIQGAHLNVKTSENDMMFYGMDISERISSKEMNGLPRTPPCPPRRKSHRNGQFRDKLGKIQLYSNIKHLSNISEEERWSEIEAMSPMSPTDKVAEFLIQSQSMLKSYSQLRNIDIPDIRLQIIKEYINPREAGSTSTRADITDIKLEAIISRGPSRRSKAGCDVTRSRSEPAICEKKHSDVELLPSGGTVERVDITERQLAESNLWTQRQRTTPV